MTLEAAVTGPIIGKNADSFTPLGYPLLAGLPLQRLLSKLSFWNAELGPEMS